MKLSVIVPVYNTERYLRKCLDSILAQTFTDYEIIIVNDASPDQSQVIIDEYMQVHSCITCIKKPNGGISDARNAGLKIAGGEYISFIDSDDYIREDMFEKMIKKAESEDFDLVCCDMDYIFEDGKTKTVSSHIESDLRDFEAIKESMTRIYPAPWNKIYHRRLFDHGVRFTKGVWYEDMEFIYRLYPYIKSIGTIKEPFNQYVQHPGAITYTYDERLFDYIKNWQHILSDYEKLGLMASYHDELEFSCVRYLYATFIKRAANYSDKKLFDQAVDKAMAMIHERFPDYKKNKYFKGAGLKGLYLLTFNRLTANLVYYKTVNKLG